MIRTMYTVNRSMNVLQKRQENTSGNLANSNTPGYKFKNVMQSTLEPYEMVNYAAGKNKDKKQVLGEFIFGNQVDESIVNFQSGTPYETGNFTDFAIQGDGFFTIELAGGGRGYTRNGNFRVDENSMLVTQTGDRVLMSDRNGANVEPVYIYDNIQVDNNGRVVQFDAKFLISEFNNPEDLIDLGNNIFTTNGGVTIVDNPPVMQNYLESSNVDFTKAIIDMIEVSREFESNQKMIQAADETLSKAVNEIGRL